MTARTKIKVGDKVKVIVPARELPLKAAKFSGQTGTIIGIIDNYHRVKFGDSKVAAYIASELARVEDAKQ